MEAQGVLESVQAVVVEGSLASPPPSGVVAAAATVETVGLPRTLQQHMRECTPKERRCAELFVLYGNQSQAWREAFGHEDERPCTRHWVEACRVFDRPWVLAYVRELRIDYARVHAADVASIVASDLAIVAAAEHSSRLSRIELRCCRYCHGQGFKYQWRDADEFAVAIAQVMDENAEAAIDHKRQKPLPNDDGGYGFDSRNDPHPACPQCEGHGHTVTIFGDTRHLGPAAPLFAGVKSTKNGIEVQTHDVGKAKERIARMLGAYGDDAASVARGAAAGAAAGASAGAALAAAKAAEGLTADQCQRLYLQVIGS